MKASIRPGLVLALCLYAGVRTLLLCNGFQIELIDQRAMNLWFDADIPRVFDVMVDRLGDHGSSFKHPVFSLLSWSPVALLASAGIPDRDAVSTLLVANAILFAGLFSSYLLALKLDMFRTACLTIMCVESAAFQSFFAVPETFPFGATTVLIGLLPAAFPGRAKLPVKSAAIAASLAITITNVWSGLVAVAATRLRETETLGFTRRVRAVGTAVALPAIIGGTTILILALAQDQIFSRAGMFVNPRALAGESQFLTWAPSTWPERALALVSGPWFVGDASLVATHASGRSVGYVLAPRWTGGPDLLLAGAWAVLTISGALASLRRERSQLLFAATIVWISFIALHLFYGPEPFLFVAHLLPLAAILVASSPLFTGRALPLALGIFILSAYKSSAFVLEARTQVEWALKSL